MGHQGVKGLLLRRHRIFDQQVIQYLVVARQNGFPIENHLAAGAGNDRLTRARLSVRHGLAVLRALLVRDHLHRWRVFRIKYSGYRHGYAVG